MQDRWEQMAKRDKGGGSGPRYPLIEPLLWLMNTRQERLEAGAEPYYPPIRLVLPRDARYILPVWEGKAAGSGILFATESGAPITHDEAYLAGAFGREGVEECLSMTIAVYRRAEATPKWIERHVERSALERMDVELGRRRGRPTELKADAEAVRKRIARRVADGEAALNRYIGPDWPRHLVPNLPTQKEEADGN
jgi:hypothetical protein